MTKAERVKTLYLLPYSPKMRGGEGGGGRGGVGRGGYPRLPAKDRNLRGPGPKPWGPGPKPPGDLAHRPLGPGPPLSPVHLR